MRSARRGNFKGSIFEGLRERKSKGRLHFAARFVHRSAASCVVVFRAAAFFASRTRIASFLRRGYGVAPRINTECMQVLARSERVQFRRAFRSYATAVYLIRAAPATPPQTSRSQKRVAACRRNTSRKLVFQREICKSMSRCIVAGSPAHLKFI